HRASHLSSDRGGGGAVTGPVIMIDEAALRCIVAEEVAKAVDSMRVEIRLALKAPSTAPLIDPDEFAALLVVHPRTLHRMELAGDVPTAIRIGPKTVRWRRDVIDRWLESGGKALSIRRGHR